VATQYTPLIERIPIVEICFAGGSMRFVLATATLGALTMSSVAFAQSTPIHGIEFGVSEVGARTHINAACAEVTRITIDDTRFPLASTNEVHLRCRGLTLADGRSAGDAMFTFADDLLVMIETRDEPTALIPDTDPVAKIAGFEAYMPQMILINRETGRAWMLATLELVSTAFSWNNPAWGNDHPAAPSGAYSMPAEIVFGAALADIERNVKDICDIIQVDNIETIWLDTRPAKQQQLNCYGIDIGGYPRKLEFVFGDGVLEQMWILFGSGDIERLRFALTTKYGPPIHVDDTYEAFDGWRIAIRKDVPEILMGSDRLAEIWRRDGR
jgi:hypothetical protein